MTLTISIQPQVEMLVQRWFSKERHNQAVYYAMADTLEYLGWTGSAKLFRKSGDEEGEHAAKVASHAVARDCLLMYEMIPQFMPLGADDLLPYFEEAYKAECDTTVLILEVYREAQAAEDFQLLQFLQFFLEEQTKSVNAVSEWRMKINHTPNELRILDEQFGELAK